MTKLEFVAVGTRRPSHRRLPDSCSRKSVAAATLAALFIVLGDRSGDEALARVALNPNPLVFQPTVLGATDQQDLRLSLASAVAFRPTISGLAGEQAIEFGLTDSCGGKLLEMECTVSVTFSPKEPGLRKARLEVLDERGRLLDSVALAGTGIPGKAADRVVRQPTDPPPPMGPPPPVLSPVALIFPNPANFSPQEVGAESGAYPITVQNTGEVAFVIRYRSRSGSDDFQLKGRCDGQRLEPKEACHDEIVFMPRSVGAISRSVDVLLNEKLYGTMEMAGSGVAASVPGIRIEPAALEFTSGVETRVITVSNPGNAPLQIARIEAVANEKQFHADVKSCIQHLPPGGSCQMSVRVLQDRRTSVRSAQLQMTHNALGSPSTILVTAAPFFARLAADPSSLDFPRTLVNRFKELQLRISNSGIAATEPLKISVSGNSRAFAADTSSCAIIGPNESCTLVVRFRPPDVGEYADALFIWDSKSDRLQIRLAGVGYSDTAAEAGRPQ